MPPVLAETDLSATVVIGGAVTAAIAAVVTLVTLFVNRSAAREKERSDQDALTAERNRLDSSISKKADETSLASLRDEIARMASAAKATSSAHADEVEYYNARIDKLEERLAVAELRGHGFHDANVALNGKIMLLETQNAVCESKLAALAEVVEGLREALRTERAAPPAAAPPAAPPA